MTRQEGKKTTSEVSKQKGFSDIIFIYTKKINQAYACSKKEENEVPEIMWVGRTQTDENETRIHAITMASRSLQLYSEQPSLP